MSLAELLPALHELPKEEKQRAFEYLKLELQQDRAKKSPKRIGLWEGMPGFWMAPDFDAPLDDFKEYME